MTTPDQLHPVSPKTIEYYGKRYRWFGSVKTKAEAEREISRLEKSYQLKATARNFPEYGGWHIYIRPV